MANLGDLLTYADLTYAVNKLFHADLGSDLFHMLFKPCANLCHVSHSLYVVSRNSE